MLLLITATTYCIVRSLDIIILVTFVEHGQTFETEAEKFLSVADSSVDSGLMDMFGTPHRKTSIYHEGCLLL